MNDITLTDMSAFLERQERKSRRLLFAIVSVSLAVSVVIFMLGLREKGTPGAALADQWLPIFFYPLFLVAFWSANALWGRTRPKPPGGRYLMNADDARNTVRVANAGFVFVAGFGAIMIASQSGIAMAQFDNLQSLGKRGDMLGRAILVSMGALSIYFGNSWARMPTPRAREQKPATQMKYLRLSAWICVITGLMLVLAALLPSGLMPPAVLIVSVSVVLAWVAYFFKFRNAMKSPSAT